MMQARAMVNTIAAHAGKVTAVIDGVCASAATFIACACASVAMNDGGIFMVHNAMGIAIGDHVELNKQADVLKKVTNTIAADYAAKTGGTTDAMLALMDAETYMNAEEALEAGFIDEIIDTRNDKATEPKNAAKLPIIQDVADSVVEPEEPEPNFEQLRIKAKARALELSADA